MMTTENCYLFYHCKLSRYAGDRIGLGVGRARGRLSARPAMLRDGISCNQHFFLTESVILVFTDINLNQIASYVMCDVLDD